MSEPRSSGRRPRLHEVGESPDYRFTLANERTFLAWVRTALAMMAAGVAVIRFVPGLAVIRHGLGFLLIGIGGLLAAASYRHWERNERAMRLGRELPQSFIPRLVAGSLVLAALVALALVIADLAG
jgi:putative membrane protein